MKPRIWWAYIHSNDRQLKLKEDNPNQTTTDLAHALDDWFDNPNILVICFQHVYADNFSEAYRKAYTYFTSRNYHFTGTLANGLITKPGLWMTEKEYQKYLTETPKWSVTKRFGSIDFE